MDVRPSTDPPQAPASAPAGHPQARAPRTQPFDHRAFGPAGDTTLRWLGMAGFLINSRGSSLMIDPLLEGFDMPLLIDFPITPAEVPHLDAVLVTHSDNDHYSVPTCRALAGVTHAYHSTGYLASLMDQQACPPTATISARSSTSGRCASS